MIKGFAIVERRDLIEKLCDIFAAGMGEENEGGAHRAAGGGARDAIPAQRDDPSHLGTFSVCMLQSVEVSTTCIMFCHTGMLKFFRKLARVALRILLIYLALYLVDEETLSEEIPSGKIATDAEPPTTSIKGIVEQVIVWFTVYLHSHCTIQAATTQPVLTKPQVTLPYYMCSCKLGIFF